MKPFAFSHIRMLVVLVLGVLASAIWLEVAAAEPASLALAVGDFDVQGVTAEEAGLGRGLREMLITDLACARGIRVVERARLKAVLDELALAETGYVDPATAAKAGKGVGAQAILMGRVSFLDGSFRIDARLVHVATGQVILAEKIAGQRSDFFKLEKDLAMSIIESFGISLSAFEKAEVQTPHTDSIEAASAVGEALKRADEDDWQGAQELLTGALVKDANFNLAKKLLARIRETLNKAEDAQFKAAIRRVVVFECMLSDWPWNDERPGSLSRVPSPKEPPRGRGVPVPFGKEAMGYEAAQMRSLQDAGKPLEALFNWVVRLMPFLDEVGPPAAELRPECAGYFHDVLIAPYGYHGLIDDFFDIGATETVTFWLDVLSSDTLYRPTLADPWKGDGEPVFALSVGDDFREYCGRYYSLVPYQRAQLRGWLGDLEGAVESLQEGIQLYPQSSQRYISFLEEIRAAIREGDGIDKWAEAGAKSRRTWRLAKPQVVAGIAAFQDALVRGDPIMAKRWCHVPRDGMAGLCREVAKGAPYCLTLSRFEAHPRRAGRNFVCRGLDFHIAGCPVGGEQLEARNVLHISRWGTGFSGIDPVRALAGDPTLRSVRQGEVLPCVLPCRYCRPLHVVSSVDSEWVNSALQTLIGKLGDEEDRDLDMTIEGLLEAPPWCVTQRRSQVSQIIEKTCFRDQRNRNLSRRAILALGICPVGTSERALLGRILLESPYFDLRMYAAAALGADGSPDAKARLTMAETKEVYLFVKRWIQAALTRCERRPASSAAQEGGGTVVHDVMPPERGSGQPLPAVLAPTKEVEPREIQWLGMVLRPIASDMPGAPAQFFIAECETTQSQYRAVMNKNPSFSVGDLERPVESVTWEETVGFCRELTALEGANLPRGLEYRLPTETEWERACPALRSAHRGNGSPADQSVGRDELGQIAWHWENTAGALFMRESDSSYLTGPQPIGRKRANGWGVFDMQGNVWEWCSESVEHPPGSEPDAPAQRLHICRGGSWASLPENCQPDSRQTIPSGVRSRLIGFRVVLAPQLKTSRTGLVHDRPPASLGHIAKTVTGSAPATTREIRTAAELPPFLVPVERARFADVEGLAAGSEEALESQRAAVEGLGLPLELRTRRTGIHFRLIPPGSFAMGSPESEQDYDRDAGREKQHTETVEKWLYVGKFEVTQKTWENVMHASPLKQKKVESLMHAISPEQKWRGEQLPVFFVSIGEILPLRISAFGPETYGSLGPAAHQLRGQGFLLPGMDGFGQVPPRENTPRSPGVVDDEPKTFLQALGELEGATQTAFRLLTSAEWEYACRAGTSTPFYFGENLSPHQANIDRYHGRGPLPVGQFRPNAWGLYDMHGNIAEWVPSGGRSYRYRGGSYDARTGRCRSAFTGESSGGGDGSHDAGLRICISPEVFGELESQTGLHDGESNRSTTESGFEALNPGRDDRAKLSPKVFNDTKRTPQPSGFGAPKASPPGPIPLPIVDEGSTREKHVFRAQLVAVSKNPPKGSDTIVGLWTYSLKKAKFSAQVDIREDGVVIWKDSNGWEGTKYWSPVGANAYLISSQKGVQGIKGWAIVHLPIVDGVADCDDWGAGVNSATLRKSPAGVGAGR